MSSEKSEIDEEIIKKAVEKGIKYGANIKVWTALAETDAWLHTTGLILHIGILRKCDIKINRPITDKTELLRKWIRKIIGSVRFTSTLYAPTFKNLGYTAGNDKEDNKQFRVDVFFQLMCMKILNMGIDPRELEAVLPYWQIEQAEQKKFLTYSQEYGVGIIETEKGGSIEELVRAIKRLMLQRQLIEMVKWH
jgi:hypothetical protein